MARERRPARGKPPERIEEAAAPERRRSRLGLLARVAILAGVFAVVSALAELLGAANLGTAFGIGQIAFAIALVALFVWPREREDRPRGGRDSPKEGPPRPR